MSACLQAYRKGATVGMSSPLPVQRTNRLVDCRPNCSGSLQRAGRVSACLQAYRKGATVGMSSPLPVQRTNRLVDCRPNCSGS